MRTDRELLLLAAKAAGMEGWRYAGGSGMCKMLDPTHPDSTGSIGPNWNPLTCDGDALRLAVDLHMGIQSNGPDHWQSPNCTIVLFDGPVCGHRLTQKHNGDPKAATRRAIVRAAAEIGAMSAKQEGE